MQEEIDLEVTDGKLNDVPVRNLPEETKSYETVFKDISKFDKQNPIVGSLLR